MYKCLFSLFALLLLVSPLHAEQAHTQISDLLQELENQHVHFVNFLFTDILGAIKEVTVPIAHVKDALLDGLAFDGSSIAGCSNISASDLLLKPDLDTMRVIPWLQGVNKTAVILCDIYLDSETPFEGNPRYVLKKLLQELQPMGYSFNVGPELEFFFIKPENGQPMDQDAYFAAETNAQHYIQKTSIMHLLTQMGINIEKLHHEVASGQHEVSLRYGNALHLADQVVLAKYVLQTIAQEYGYKVTFMPKPFAHQNGSAMHIHFSLWDNIHKKNIFYDEEKKQTFSLQGQNFIAGVLMHMQEITALFNPIVNSFKRLVKGYEAPVFVCWGSKNRSALIRAPHIIHPSSSRAELRCPDPSCNPYLAFAALLKAGLDGLAHEHYLPSPVEENLYKLDTQQLKRKNIQALPQSLDEALNLLEESSFAKELLGAKLLENFISIKRQEALEYRLHVTDWEIKRYL